MVQIFLSLTGTSVSGFQMTSLKTKFNVSEGWEVYSAQLTNVIHEEECGFL